MAAPGHSPRREKGASTAYTQLRNTQIPGLDAPLGMQEKTSQGSLFYSTLLVTELSWNKLV